MWSSWRHGSSWLLAALIGLSSHAAWAEVPISENANRRFKEGVRYLTTGTPDYERAYREFKAAYADSPSWKILGNLGIVAQALERDGEAIDAYQAYLEQGGNRLSAEDRKQFTEDLALLQQDIVTVRIETQPDGAWIVDERLPVTGSPIVNRYGPTKGPLELRVRAGHHRIRAELAGHESEPWELDSKPHERVAHEFVLRRAGEQREAAAARAGATFGDVEPRDTGSGGSAMRTTSYIAFGAGAVGLGLGTLFYLRALDSQSDADAAFDECAALLDSPGACGPAASQSAQAAALRSDAMRFNAEEKDRRTLSLVSFVGGGALAATGLVLFLLSDDDEAPANEARVVPCTFGYGLCVDGRF